MRKIGKNSIEEMAIESTERSIEKKETEVITAVRTVEFEIQKIIDKTNEELTVLEEEEKLAKTEAKQSLYNLDSKTQEEKKAIGEENDAKAEYRSKQKGKKGLCILACGKKKPFLADPKFLSYKGFEPCDEADNGVQLWYLPFEKEAGQPRFKEIARHPYIDEKGYVLFYTCQCPYNAKYVPVLENLAKEKDIKFKAVHIKSREEARNVPTPITTYALFCDGKYVTNEQMNDKRFLKMISN